MDQWRREGAEVLTDQSSASLERPLCSNSNFHQAKTTEMPLCSYHALSAKDASISNLGELANRDIP